MTMVRQLLDQKGRKIWSIHPDATVFDAVAKMAEKDVGSLVVMDGDELVGDKPRVPFSHADARSCR
jgi:CBS domain-containing protein